MQSRVVKITHPPPQPKKKNIINPKQSGKKFYIYVYNSIKRKKKNAKDREILITFFGKT